MESHRSGRASVLLVWPVRVIRRKPPGRRTVTATSLIGRVNAVVETMLQAIHRNSLCGIVSSRSMLCEERWIAA
jgi:hypothetical protein